MTAASEAPVGIFGGTFNPIHLGHLRAAEEVREALGLERIVFVPSADPPLKRGGPEPWRRRARLAWVGSRPGNARFPWTRSSRARGSPSVDVAHAASLGGARVLTATTRSPWTPARPRRFSRAHLAVMSARLRARGSPAGSEALPTTWSPGRCAASTERHLAAARVPPRVSPLTCGAAARRRAYATCSRTRSGKPCWKAGLREPMKLASREARAALDAALEKGG
jgi:cytidyltransferase-like protein